MAAPLALSALFTGVAQAGVGASAVPSFPPTVTVGQSGLEGTVELRNTNSDSNAGETNTVCNFGDGSPCPAGSRGIILTPSCAAQGPDAACTTFDPGVFAIAPTAVGAQGTACAGSVFDVVLVDPATGQVRFAPRATHVILPGAGAVCRIAFTFSVVKSPSTDADASVPGVQTFQVAENAQHNGSLPAFARGTSVGVTVQRAQPAIATTASPPVRVGGQLTDAARVTGRVSPVGGTVDFRLYGPDDATCSRAPVFVSPGRPVAADGTAVSAPFTPTAAGTYRWRASYSGDASNLPVAGDCNDAGENVTVSPPPPPPTVTVLTRTEGGPCVKTAFDLRVRVRAQGLDRVKVKLDGRIIETSPNARFTLKVRAKGLKEGRHTLKIIALGEGGRTVRRATFFRCGKPSAPRFVG